MARVGLIGENSIEYIDVLLDIWNSGDCAVLIDWQIPYQTVCKMMIEAKVEKCHIEKKIFEKITEDVHTNIEFIAFDKKSNSAELLPEALYDKFVENYSRKEAIVIYSSGTTGRAKGIILSHYAINTNADAIIDYMELTSTDCIYVAKTISHSSTITGELLVALKTRMKVVIAPVIVPPRYVLDNLKKFAVTIICLNPTLLSMYLEEYKKRNYDLLSLRVIYVSGAILNDKIYTMAHEVFKNIQIYNAYGLSEASPRVTAQRYDCCKSNSVGKPIKGIDIIIVDDNGNVVSVGERGIIHVNTPTRFNGYASGNEKHKSFYKKWLNTGDIGYFDRNGELHIMDRIDNVIIIDSHKIYPSEIERHIQNNSSVIECVVLKVEFSNKEFISCLYVADQEIENDIKAKLAKILLKHEIPRIFIKCDDHHIPRTMNGKISIQEAKKMIIKSFKAEEKHDCI